MASFSVDPAQLGHAQPEPVPMSYSENEDDVDQLDSESDIETPALDASSETQQKPVHVEEQRLPGSSLFPLARIENAIQAECVTGHLSMSREASFVVSVATEEFIKRFVQAGYRESCNDHRSTVNYRDMAATVMQYQEFMFLEETVPVPIPLREALLRREAKEKELLEADPVMSTGGSHSGPISLSHSGASRSKGKNRVANGKDKGDGGGSSSSVKRERKSKDVNGRWHYTNEYMAGVAGVNGVPATWPHCSWQDERLPFRSTPSSAPQNGVAPYASEGEFNANRAPANRVTHTTTTVPPQDDQAGSGFTPPPVQHQQTTFPQSENWPTGPASAFLQPRGSFTSIPANSGRTIYSQPSTDSGSFQ